MMVKSPYGVTKINKDKISTLIKTKKFQEKIKEIRNRFNIDSRGFNNSTEVQRWQAEKMESGKINEFNRDINNLLVEFSLSSNFETSIMTYILWNKSSYIPARNYAIDLSSDNINVTIFSKPTKEEWTEIKNNVDIFLENVKNRNYKFLQKFNYPYGKKPQKPKRNIKRTLAILETLSDNKSLEQIEVEVFEDAKNPDTDFVTKSQSKKNINVIKTTKNRLKNQGYL